MSKELEAFSEIHRFIVRNLGSFNEEEKYKLGFDIGLIENALKRLEQLENKEFVFCGRMSSKTSEYDKFLKIYTALQILKEKKVNLEAIYNKDIDNLNDYNTYFCFHYYDRLNEFEFNLLKEVIQ